MKASELRIGNYVTLGDPKAIFVSCDVDQIFSIEKDRVELFNDGNYGSASSFSWHSMDRVNPIPLTEDWLKRFGFVKDGNSFTHTQNDAYKSKIVLMRDSLLKLFKVGFQHTWYSVDCVHQLQNLYFALTGEELILKS